MMEPPLESFTFGNLSGHILLFGFLVLISLILCFVLYGMCAYPSWRRMKFRVWKGSRIWGGVMGGGVFIMLLTLIYTQNWMEFYQMDLEKDKLHLHYNFPKRIQTLTFAQIKEIKKGVTLDKFNDRQLIICTKEGKKYKSANVCEATYNELFLILRKYL